MANASVEKLKALGLRHGEKAVMGLTAVLCVFFLFKAATRETIALTPEQVREAAQQAESNLNRKQPPEDILKLIEAAGIKNPGFETIVEQQQKNLLVAANYRAPQLWVTPEPGAGLIRDMPELIAPTELYAYPGRGGALVFALDDNGNRIPDPDAGKTQDEDTKERRKKKHKHLGASALKKKAREEKKKKEAEEKRQLEAKRKANLVVGIGAAMPEPTGETATAEVPEKEVVKGVRWVAITGVLDYKTLRANYLSALKREEVAYPHFKQLDVERQVKQTDGSWTDWEPIDLDRNRQVLDNLPEEEEEWTPETVRISALVHPLPFLKAGLWERVHVGRMVPKEKLEVAAAPAAGADMAGAMPEPMPQPEPPSMEMPADPGMSPGMEGSYGGPVETINFEKTEADEIMIRALDFTVDPDVTYRFRVRIVVYNPNRGREDVSYGVDTKSVELFGPWSEPTEEVTMPSDVATYAINKEPTVPRKLDQVNYEVARWTPDDGVTVVKRFSAAPGEIIGELRSADIPSSEGKGKKSQRVDFNSHQVVLDVMGGSQPIPPLGPGTAGRLDVPAVSLVIRPDGAVVVRSQAKDLHDQVRKDMADNYARELKASDKKRDNAQHAPGDPGMP